MKTLADAYIGLIAYCLICDIFLLVPNITEYPITMFVCWGWIGSILIVGFWSMEAILFVFTLIGSAINSGE